MPWLDAARDAFTYGLQAAALTSAAIAAGAALLAIVLLRRVGAGSLKESHAVSAPSRPPTPHCIESTAGARSGSSRVLNDVDRTQLDESGGRLRVVASGFAALGLAAGGGQQSCVVLAAGRAAA